MRTLASMRGETVSIEGWPCPSRGYAIVAASNPAHPRPVGAPFRTPTSRAHEIRIRSPQR